MSILEPMLERPEKERYNRVAGYLHTQVIVAGDCRTSFFRSCQSRELVDHIITDSLGSALAWNLINPNSTSNGRAKILATIEGARDFGYRGWVMLTFGSTDLHSHIMHHAVKDGLVSRVKETVRRYLAFIDEAVQIFPRIAVFGPPGAVPDEEVHVYNATNEFPGTWGSELDRNFALMLFNKLLEQGLRRRRLPFVGLHDMIIQADGRSKGAYFTKGMDLQPSLMPYVLDLIEHELGITIPRTPELSNYAPREIKRLENVNARATSNRKWLTIPFLNFMLIDSLSIFTSSKVTLPVLEISLEKDPDAHPPLVRAEQIEFENTELIIPVELWTEQVSFRFTAEHFEAQTIKVFATSGYFSTAFHHGEGQRAAMETAVARLSRSEL